MRPVCVLDACVLVPPGLRDLLISLADVGVFRPVWQDTILDETLRNGVKLLVERGSTDAAAHKKMARTLENMSTAFPDASLDEDEWTPLEAKCTNHPKDRHVLAAAMAAAATHLVTDNLRDFPPASRPADLAVLKPDPFLLAMLDREPDAVLAGLRAMAARHRNPAHTVQELATTLSSAERTKRFGSRILALL